MTEPFFPYYERELLFLRQLAQEFARQYPAAAGRLLLEPNRSADSYVERLLESFALIAGGLQHKLDDEFPEFTDPLLNVVFPHYLLPIPSMAVLQFNLDAAAAQLPEGFAILPAVSCTPSPWRVFRASSAPPTPYASGLWP